jgi:phage gp36-like protein
VPARCEPAVADPLAATVDTFIRNTTVIEAVELSNLDSGGSSIDCERLNGALLDAYNELQGEKLLMPELCKQIVDANLSRWMVVIARYYLDNIRRRPDVTKDYELVLAKLKELHETKGSAGNGSGLAPNTYSQISASFGKQPVWTQQSLKQYRSQK